jgi:hypothetical protein
VPVEFFHATVFGRFQIVPRKIALSQRTLRRQGAENTKDFRLSLRVSTLSAREPAVGRSFIFTSSDRVLATNQGK